MQELTEGNLIAQMAANDQRKKPLKKKKKRQSNVAPTNLRRFASEIDPIDAQELNASAKVLTDRQNYLNRQVLPELAQSIKNLKQFKLSVIDEVSGEAAVDLDKGAVETADLFEQFAPNLTSQEGIAQAQAFTDTLLGKVANERQKGTQVQATINANKRRLQRLPVQVNTIYGGQVPATVQNRFAGLSQTVANAPPA